MFKDLTGLPFGRLYVLSRAENRNGDVFWLTRCDCGVETEVYAWSLEQGYVKSCGGSHEQ